MRVQFNPGEKLWNGAVAGIGVLGTATSVVMKTFLKSGYGAYVAGRKVLTDAKGTVVDIAAEAKAEIRAEKEGVRQRRRDKERSGSTKPEKETASHTGLKPGSAAPASGHYQEIGPRGGKGREIDSEKGERLPPTTKKGGTYTLVDENGDE